MTNFFTSISYLITGDSKAELSKYDSGSRKRIQLLGMLVLIPTIIWFITGYLLMSCIFYASNALSVLAGTILALLIFFIDRSIILATKGWFTIIFRFLLGTTIALLGSFFIDTIIFGQDIEAYAIEKYHLSQKASLESLNHAYDKASADYFGEMNGTAGSKLKGFGKITEAKEREKNKADDEHKALSQKIEHELLVLNDPGHPDRKVMLSKLGLLSLSNRIVLFNELKKKDSYIFLIWLLIFGAMAFIEFLPVSIKSFSTPTSYELDCEARKELLAHRRQLALENAKFYYNRSVIEQEADRLIKKI